MPTSTGSSAVTSATSASMEKLNMHSKDFIKVDIIKKGGNVNASVRATPNKKSDEQRTGADAQSLSLDKTESATQIEPDSTEMLHRDQPPRTARATTSGCCLLMTQPFRPSLLPSRRSPPPPVPGPLMSRYLLQLRLACESDSTVSSPITQDTIDSLHVKECQPRD